MIEAFLKTIREVFTPFFWLILFLNLIITVAFFYGVYQVISSLIDYYIASYEWLDKISGVGAMFITYFLFPVIFPLISYLFQDFITSKLNKKYNDTPPKGRYPISYIIMFAIKFAVISVILNLLLLPLYFIPVIGLLIYFILNSYLLGKEYYQLCAYTLLEKEEIDRFRTHYRNKILLAGMVMSALFLTPIVNIFAPILGVIYSWFYIQKLNKKFPK